MPLVVDLNKSERALRLSLQKHGIVTPPQADLAFNLDVSGSFRDEHEDGLTQDLLSRLVPWGMVFDPDKKLDVFTFSDGREHVHHVGDITPATVDGYIQNRIIDRVPGWRGGTDYSYVLEKNLQHFGWLPKEQAVPASRSFFGFGRSKPAPAAPVEKKRSIVIHVTDGDNSDHERTEHVLAESEARGDQVYFLFIGISNQGGGFPFLKKIGDRFSNTGLVVIRDLRRWAAQDDDVINNELIGDELVQWLKK